MDAAPSNYVDCAWFGGVYAGGLLWDYIFYGLMEFPLHGHRDPESHPRGGGEEPVGEFEVCSLNTFTKNVIRKGWEETTG